eukprot:TRINITY_DN5132_c0_g1_i1.p1 TRINITY_DN5132_c0_g1~~TRINITY_DN5132_c0_g1_i1.p1  ORF type:complete len:149 (+),score=32.26 TRINITY_DN5132_c0_g1_i1:60-449(+)
MADNLYTWEQVSKHNTEKDCWVVIEGIVYNVTKFLDEHPGGSEILMNVAGKDATTDFKNIGHSQDATRQLEDLKQGRIDPTSPKIVPPPPITVIESSKPSIPNPNTSWGPSVVIAGFIVAILAIVVYLT